MIKSLQEIKKRFDKIKDNKPKASKKLNELGDILASAYKIDKTLANDMWQYLIELNVTDTPENARFYITQVFNKLTDRLNPQEATELAAMSVDRIRLMIQYGYTGYTKWDCLDALIKGFLKMNDVENCIFIVKLYCENYEQRSDGHEYSTTIVKKSIQYASELYQNELQFKDVFFEFMHELIKNNNDKISAYVRILMVTLGYEDHYDLDEMFYLANKYHFGSEFIELLWDNREFLSAEKFTDIWINYLKGLDPDCYGAPIPDFKEEIESLRESCDQFTESRYDGSKMQFFVSLMKNNDTILKYYFNCANKLVNYIIYSFISEGDWDRFIQYMSQMISNTYEPEYEFSDVKCLLDCYMDSYFRESVDEYGRSNTIVTKKNLDAFENALATISVRTIDCTLHDEYHENIKEFMKKTSGNLDALNKVGFNEKNDERTPEQRLKDYVHNFLQTGIHEHDNNCGEYRRICKAFYDEDIKKANSMEERAYSHAMDDEISEFYFLHCLDKYGHKAAMISACIRKDYINRADELVELLLETANYNNCLKSNPWLEEITSVAYRIVRNFTIKSYRRNYIEMDDEQIDAVNQIIRKIIPYLSSNDTESICEDLTQMIPDQIDEDEYIINLMSKVELYTTFPKPRGKGNAKVINRLSEKIMDSFAFLAYIDRLDVISQIFTKFYKVKDILAPVEYSTWIHILNMELSTEDFYEVYKMNKCVFKGFL